MPVMRWAALVVGAATLGACASSVEVDHFAYDETLGCWTEVTTVRDARWWRGYDGEGGCDDLAWDAVEDDGTCIRLTALCNDAAHLDPALSSCADFPACCSTAVTEAPYCPVD